MRQEIKIARDADSSEVVEQFQKILKYFKLKVDVEYGEDMAVVTLSIEEKKG